MSGTPAIRVQGLSKSFGGRAVIKDLSFELEIGLSLLTGKNGSGKTTLLNLLAGSLRPDRGAVYVLGSPVRAVTDRIALVPAEPPEIPWLTGAAFVSFVTSLYPLTRRDEEGQSALLETLEIAQMAPVRLGEMSSGARKKFVLVAMLAASPAILLFDEPTAGLDESSCERLVKLLAQETLTKAIVLATHEPWRFSSLARREVCL
jgi:ABC-type multidrug transport system ATPase subunit